MSNELRERVKLCPFCRLSPVVFDYYGEKYAYCSDEHCVAGHSEASVPLSVWNEQPEIDALKAENERLKSALAVIDKIASHPPVDKLILKKAREALQDHDSGRKGSAIHTVEGY